MRIIPGDVYGRPGLHDDKIRPDFDIINVDTMDPPIVANNSGSLGPAYDGNIRISACCSQGGRKYMEDRISIQCKLSSDGSVDYIFIGVFDGHGGADASHFAKEHLFATIVEQPGFDSAADEDVLNAIKAGFLETHNAMRKVVDMWPRTASGFTSTAGTTASIALIRRGKLYIGHVGDSGIVVGAKKPNGELIGTSLTVDHKPDSPEERKRIENIGGEVMNKSGVNRVVWVRPLRGHQGPVRRSTPHEKIPFLAVARALGDLWSYNSDLDTFVVSPEPDVSVVKFDSTHRCLIFGSDGLWNVLRPQHAVEIINSHEWKDGGCGYLKNDYETNHARWLARHALMRWASLRADNISVISVVFEPRNGVVNHCNGRRSDTVSSTVDGALSLSDFLNLTTIDTTLIDHPTHVVKICNNNIHAVPSKPVELLYYGAVDAGVERPRFFNETSSRQAGNDCSNVASTLYRIPGFTGYTNGRISLSHSSPFEIFKTTPRFFSANEELINGSPKIVNAPAPAATSSLNKENDQNRAVIEEASDVETWQDDRMECDHKTTTTASALHVERFENAKGELTLRTEYDLSVFSVETSNANGQGEEAKNGKNDKDDAEVFREVRETATFYFPSPAAVTKNSSHSSPKPSAENGDVTTPITRGSGSPDAYQKTAFSTTRKRRQSLKRRSCPNGGLATPHSYNTRQMCRRTTRAGTKLTPAKFLLNSPNVDTA